MTMSIQPEIPQEKNSSLADSAIDALSKLKEDIKSPKTKLALKEKKDELSSFFSDAVKAIESFSPFKNGMMESVKGKGVLTLAAVAGFMAWLLKPEIKVDPKTSPASTSPTKKKASTKPKDSLSSIVEYATILPQSSHEKVLAGIETNAKNLNEVYQRYLKTGDPTEIRYFLFKAITAKESGSGDSPKKLRLINQAAVGPGLRKKLLQEKGIQVPPLSRAALYPNEQYLASFEAFKERTCSVLQPGVSGHERVGKATEILARCAVGKYQVLPIYWLNGVKGKKKMGEAELLAIYNYIKSAGAQQKTAMGIINGMGKKHNWNPAYVALEYYAGGKWVNVLKNDPSNPALNRKQYGGHGSMMDYIKRTTALANNLIASSQKNT